MDSGTDHAGPLSPVEVNTVESAMDLHAGLIFRRQPLSKDQQIALARAFGQLGLRLRRVKSGPHRLHLSSRPTRPAQPNSSTSRFASPLTWKVQRTTPKAQSGTKSVKAKTGYEFEVLS